MAYTNKFIVPNYYKEFKCKGKECRNSCCTGWDVTISLKEYYKLQSLKCSKTLRTLLDKTFVLKKNPNPDQYGIVQKNQHNDCPLHMEDGYCRLHKECGEKSLPLICNYYPRGIRNDYLYEASCSNSCEKTLEILFKDDEKISFEEKTLTIDLPLNPLIISDEQKSKYNGIRQICFSILSNRESSLSSRIIQMGRVLQGILNFKEESNYESIPIMFQLSDLKVDKNYDYSYSIQEKLLKHFHSRSKSIEKYSQAAIDFYNNQGPKSYKLGKIDLINKFKNIEIMFEKLLINHLYFIQFPFTYNTKTLWEEYISICGVYLFTSYITIGYMNDKEKNEDLIDVLSASFRLIDHTNFSKNINSFFNNENIMTLEQISILIYS
ncbi:MAG: flagellin lysine-N-methylase [Bacilli bacterium]